MVKIGFQTIYCCRSNDYQIFEMKLDLTIQQIQWLADLSKENVDLDDYVCDNGGINGDVSLFISKLINLASPRARTIDEFLTCDYNISRVEC